MPYLDLTKERENGTPLERFESDRGTTVEMIRCPALGIACFMDGLIQSCEMDEHVYHSALVSKTMEKASSKKRVLILGGGEGAVAREVLRSQEVEQVDMIDWDEQVVSMFRQRYPQWGNKAWSDERLTIHYEDVFSKNDYPEQSYDVIFIDLFDVSKRMKYDYQELIRKMSIALKPNGCMTMYCGMEDSMDCKNWIEEYQSQSVVLENHYCSFSNRYIPSFEGSAVFLSWFPRVG
jgi:spermidine synthase